MQEVAFKIRATFPGPDLERCAAAQWSLVTPICVQLGEVSFPEEGWTDFSIVVLGWWLEEVLSLRNGSKKDVILRLMDGPYEIVLIPITESVWSAMALDRSRGTRVHGRFAVSATQIILSIYNAGLDALSACRAGGFWDKSCDATEKRIMELDPSQV